MKLEEFSNCKSWNPKGPVPFIIYILLFHTIHSIPSRDFISARGEQLEKLSIHWLCSAVGCLYEQVSAEFIFDFLGRSCPLLRELDVSGLKNVSALSLQQLLDTKFAQVSDR